MPFATEYKTSVILKKIFGQIPDDIWEWEPYSRKKIYFLNRLDKTKLHYFKLWCENPELNKNLVYEAFDYSDKKAYVYEGNKPAYHKYETCPVLHSDFQNFKIPNEIKEQGDEAIKEFRIWFLKNEAIFTKYHDQYKVRLKFQYGIDALHDDLIVNYENSGNVFRENLTQVRVEKRIDSILENAKAYYLEDQKRKEALNQFQRKIFLIKKGYVFENNTEYSNEELKDLLLEFDAWFIQPTMYYLQEYYKIYYSNDIEIHQEIFEALNFKKCGLCYSNSYYDQEANDNNGLPQLDAQYSNFELPREPGIFNFIYISKTIRRCFIYAKYIKKFNNNSEELGIVDRLDVIVEFINHQDKFIIKNALLSAESNPDKLVCFKYYILQIDKSTEDKSVKYILHV